MPVRVARLHTIALIGSLALCGVPGTATAQSALDGFDPGANGAVRSFAVQTDGKIVVAGTFTAIGGGGTGTTPRQHVARLTLDGSVDLAFDPGANGDIRTVALLPDGKILVAGDFTMIGGGGTGTTPRARVARLNADGSVDATFDPGANAAVRAFVVQADGKIVFGGDFSTFGGGGTGTTTRNRLARLNTDGSLDASFNPGVGDTSGSVQVSALALQADGRIVVGGSFTGLGGGTGTTPRTSLGRLNADGTVDVSFNASTGGGASVNTLAMQPDGKILVGGSFNGIGGGSGASPRLNIARVNANGSIDAGFNPGANGIVNAVVIQPDGKIVAGGAFSGLGGTTGTTSRVGIGRLNPDGSVDAFNPGVSGLSSEVTGLALQTGGRILMGGLFTGLGGGTGATTRNRIGRLYGDGRVDADFAPDANNYVDSLAVQRDGAVVIGGVFTNFGGGTNARGLGRVLADGSVDTSFTASIDTGLGSRVSRLAVQPDGKILVSGTFSSLAGHEAHNIGRLNTDGTYDTTFALWANGPVGPMAIQPDGKIVIGGQFTSLTDNNSATTVARANLARINPDGSIDPSFNPGAAGGTDTVFIHALAVQTDGKILAGGYFQYLGGGTGTVPRKWIGRLNADGSVDMGFDPGANRAVSAFAIQPDGKILVAGSFGALGGGTTNPASVTRSAIGRINADGSVDMGFDPGAGVPSGGAGPTWVLALQTDGKIIVAGNFTRLGGGGYGVTIRNHIGRLNPDGSVDMTFDPGADDFVSAVELLPDGKLVVGGGFTHLGGGGTGTTVRNRLGRIANTTPSSESILLAGGSGSVKVWLRGGGMPDLSRVTFEQSLDGVSYSVLGAGERTSGGWLMMGSSLPVNQNVYLRLRGYYGGGTIVGSVAEYVERVFLRVSPDFDGDSRADMPVYDAATGQWRILGSVGGYTLPPTIVTWGGPGYTPVPADYDGDGRMDLGLYRDSTGQWTILTSSSGFTTTIDIPSWGGAGYLPVAADYDGDQRADPAVYNRATGVWSVLLSSTNYVSHINVSWGGAGYLPVPGDFDGDGLADCTVYRPSTGGWSVLQSSGNFLTALNTNFGGPGWRPVPGDYDGDDISDIAVYDLQSGVWSALVSSTTFTSGFTRGWGGTGYLPVPGDYDGDGKTDLGLFNRHHSTWYVLKSDANYTTTTTASFGTPGENPVSAAVLGTPNDQTRGGDHDSDLRSDLTVYETTTGMWLTLTSASEYGSASNRGWGGTGYTPAPGDYDGDGRRDPAYYHAASGSWSALTSSSGFTAVIAASWGGIGYEPVARDYDGDGRTDFGVYRTATGSWLILTSASNYTSSMTIVLGGTGDMPVPADYDGDGRADPACYRAATGDWSVLTSSSNYTVAIAQNVGGGSVVAVPGDFDGDRKADFATYNSSTGMWNIRTSSSSYAITIAVGWGGSGYVPVAGDYDGDGRTDLALYVSSTGGWLILTSSSQYSQVIARNWGGAGYTALPAYP